MRFQLASRLMILDSWMTLKCYVPIFGEFRVISPILEAKTAKLTKIATDL